LTKRLPFATDSLVRTPSPHGTIRSRRIVSLLASGTEILYALGLGDRVVAVSHECDYPEEARQKPRATFTRVAVAASSKTIDEQVRQSIADGAPLYEVDFDLLERLRPDLIVTQAQCDVCAVRYDDVLAAVEQSPLLTGARIVALNPRRLEDIFHDILRVADMAGEMERGKRCVTDLRVRLQAVRQRASRIAESERPRVVCLEWTDPLMVAANWTPEMIQAAGGRHELAQAGVHSTNTPWQTIVDYQPEVIVVAPCGFDLPRSCQEAGQLRQLPGWSDLPAVRAGRVFACDGNAYFNRSGPRLVDTVEILAHLIHPRQFAAPACCPAPETVWRRV
jgi:iron complex transport system substrate-binding protein